MKIDIRSKELLGEKNNKYKLSRRVRFGVVTAALIIGIPCMMVFNNKKKSDNEYCNNPPAMPEEYQEVVLEESIEADLDQINNLNIIINDGDCSDNFMEEIYNELENDGIIFKKAKNLDSINHDNCVVITLDQQYISGPGMKIISPCSNERLGNSDALAIAMDTAFDEKGFINDGIEAGVFGFREENGKVVNRIPTKTEEKISKDKNTSFVTIAFGTMNINSSLVVSAIENGLTRYYSYIQTNNNDDLIYRATDDESIDVFAKKFNTTADYIRITNKISGDVVPVDTTIKNPKVNLIRQFNKNVPVDLNNVEKTLWSR